jgi:hypothetical protein
MNVKASSKHQVVISKKARKKPPLPKGDIMKYAGIMKGVWGKNPVATLRKMRDEEWD